MHLPRKALAVLALSAVAFGGCGSDSDESSEPKVQFSAAETDAAVASYRSYIEGQTAELLTRTTEFADAVVAGDIENAKKLYPVARAPYERIEPVAEAFGDLDPAIDGRADDVPVEDITGYHRIEEALWVRNSTAGMEPIARKLVEDVKALQERVKTVELDVALISTGATELLGEITASKVTGEEERYSHTDLWDFEANLDGSKAAIAAVRPLLDKADPALGAQIDSRYQTAVDALAPYRRDGGFVFFGELKKDDTRKLSRAIDALAEPVSDVTAKIAPKKKA